MKFLKFLRLAPIPVLLVTASCATQSTNSANTPNTHARFYEADATDLVLEYYRPDTIYMKRPDAHEGPFLTIFNRDTIATEITHRVAAYNLAVVVLGQFYDLNQQTAVIRDWESVLGDCGFNRVVFLRAGRTTAIKGLPIVQDSAIGAARHESTKPTTTLAAVSSSGQ